MGFSQRHRKQEKAEVGIPWTRVFRFSPSFPITGQEQWRQANSVVVTSLSCCSAEVLGAQGPGLGWGQRAAEKEGESWLGLCPTRPSLEGPSPSSVSRSPARQPFSPPFQTTWQRKQPPRPKPSPRVLPVCSILCSPSGSSKFSLLCPGPTLNHTWAFPSGLTSPSISKYRKAKNLHPDAFASENQRKLFYALRKL